MQSIKSNVAKYTIKCNVQLSGTTIIMKICHCNELRFINGFPASILGVRGVTEMYISVYENTPFECRLLR